MKSYATGYSGMKLLSRLVIVLVICLMAIALMAVPAQAIPCYLPFIELSSKSGVPGIEVVVDGQRFDGDEYVQIYYDEAGVATGRTDSTGDFTIAFTVPEGGKGGHKVHAEVLDKTAETYFTVKPGLTVSPQEGAVGTNVTVRGKGFAEDEEGIELRYYLNGSYETVERNITANARGSWRASVQIPASAKGEHKLDAQGGDSRFNDVEDAIFRVMPRIDIDESSGAVGETIGMTGSKFAAYEKNIQILFAGQPAATDIKADDQGEWGASFEVPEMPTGTYNVTAEGEWTRKEDVIKLDFEIEPGVVLSHNEGHVGTDVTVTGHGFAANEDVDIMYDNRQVATTRTNDKGSFEVSFSVPESQYGERQVTAQDGATNEATAILAMESDPPGTPTLISPRDGSRVGVMDRVRPTFKWSSVSDDSGVYYSLQIVTSADVAASSVIVSVTGLTETTYTLQRPLSYGTYYWIVQAVDGAENAGSWSAARSLQAGLLPLWGFIVILTSIVAVIIALVRFLLIRRGKYY